MSGWQVTDGRRVIARAVLARGNRWAVLRVTDWWLCDEEER